MPKNTTNSVKVSKKPRVKRPINRYAKFGLWFGVNAVAVAVLGCAIFLGVLAAAYWLGYASSTDELIAITFVSAIILIFALYFIANLAKRKQHTLARWTRKSLNVLVILTVVPLLITISAIETRGSNSSNQTATTSTPTQNTISPVINNEERRYQYMYCSNGTYRYYTDEEFNKQNTGFTESGPDYCAQNGQGKKVQLADVPPAAKQTNSPTTYDFPTSAWPSAPTVQPYPSLSDEPAIVPAVCDEALEVSYINAFDRDSMNLLRQWANDPYKSNYSVAQSYKNKLATLTNSTNEKLADINCSTRVRAPAVNY